MDDANLDQDHNVTFKSLGVCDTLCEACEKQNWKFPTLIQQKVIPVALQGKDVIGLSKTGTGKTAAFAIPILQNLQKKPQRMFALILTPTRELAYQISDQFKSLGSFMGIKCVVIVGDMDKKEQAKALNENPHIIIGTPGRLADHLVTTRGFYLDSIKYLVLDEADKILGKDYENDINQLLRAIPKDKRRTYLFSATMTNKLEKLERVAQDDPVKIEVSTKYESVDSLKQVLICVPIDIETKLNFLVQVLIHHENLHTIIFCETCRDTIIVSKFLKFLQFEALALNGKMQQTKRLNSIAQFKASKKSILVATDVASRGLDIPYVELVINFNLPANAKDYLHRVGRTARAGKSGKAITFATIEEKSAFLAIEDHLKLKLQTEKVDIKDVEELKEEVHSAYEFAIKDIDEYVDKRGRKRNPTREFERKHKKFKRK